MAQVPMSQMTRQARRAYERSMIRRTMTKAERREYVRMSTPVQKEIYYTTLAMIANGTIFQREEPPVTRAYTPTENQALADKLPSDSE
jgi:hypothetical protein